MKARPHVAAKTEDDVGARASSHEGGNDMTRVLLMALATAVTLTSVAAAGPDRTRHSRPPL